MKRFATLFLAAYLCIMAVYFYRHQYYNWDMEAYMGLIYRAENPKMPIEEIHKKVFNEFREKSPEKFDFNAPHAKPETENADTYYKVISENPKAYGEELEFFSVKPFYNLTNYIFYKLGLEASAATFLISVVSYILIIFFVFLFLQSELKKTWLAFIFTLLLSLFKPLHDATRHATPDMLATLLLLAAFYYIYRRRLFAATVFAMLCIFTRPEFFILFLLMFGLAILFEDILQFRRKHLMVSVAYLSLSFLLIQCFSKIPWTVLFLNQFSKVQLYPVSHPDSFGYSVYFSYIKRHILLEFNASYFLLMALFSVLVFGRNFKFSDFRNRSKLLIFSFILLVFVNVVIRFFIFPSLVNRMMVGFYLLIILTLILYQNSAIPKKYS